MCWKQLGDFAEYLIYSRPMVCFVWRRQGTQEAAGIVDENDCLLPGLDSGELVDQRTLLVFSSSPKAPMTIQPKEASAGQLSLHQFGKDGFAVANEKFHVGRAARGSGGGLGELLINLDGVDFIELSCCPKCGSPKVCACFDEIIDGFELMKLQDQGLGYGKLDYAHSTR